MKNTKRIIAVLMSALMLGTFSAVPAMTYAETDDVTQTAAVSSSQTATVTIMEINDNTLIVTPVEGSWELRFCDKFSLSAKYLESGIEPVAGMMLDVEYSGQIHEIEIYPAVFNSVKKVTLHDATTTTTIVQATMQTTAQTTTTAENDIDFGKRPPASDENVSKTAGFPENLWTDRNAEDVSLDQADITEINEIFGNIVVLAAIGNDGIYESDEYAFAGKFEHEVDLGNYLTAKPFTEYKYDEKTNTLYHAALEARMIELENGEEAFIIRMSKNENDNNFYLYTLSKQLYKGGSQWVDLMTDDFRYYILVDDSTGKYITKNNNPKPVIIKTTDKTENPLTEPVTTVCDIAVTTNPTNVMTTSDAFFKYNQTTTTVSNKESYKSMTLDEAISDISGNYVWMREKEPVFIPTSDCNRGVQTIDENNKIHNINFANIKTVIKVKNGCKLPYDEIKAEIGAKGYTMPVFRINGDKYELTWSVSKEIYDYTIDLLKKCPAVTAIETQYKIWEDKANSVSVYGISYTGDLSAEEITAKYPELEQMESLSAEAMEFLFKGDKTKLYDFFCRVNENGDDLIAMCLQTELGVMNPDYYYCSEPILIDTTAGDANIDGDVDLADSVMIMQAIANPDKYGLKAEKGITAQGMANSDTNGDGLTNMDSLEIQKSLLGMGDIPIPEKNTKADTASDDGILLANYDTVEKVEPYGYWSVIINDTELRKTGVSLNISAIGDEIGEYSVKSAEDEVTAKVYKIKNISPDYAVAVKCDGSKNYAVFNNWQYAPETMGELIDGMNLSENLTFSGINYVTYSPYKTRRCEADRELIWNAVFTDRDTEIMKHDFSNDVKNKPQRIDGKLPEGYVEFGIGCDMPISGGYKFSLKVYQNGYVTSNIIDTGISFFIAEEKAQELINYYSDI